MENKSADAQGTGGPHAQQAGGPPAVAMQPLQQPQGVQPPHQQAGMAVAMYPQPQAGGPGPIGPPQPMQQPQGGQPPHQQAAVAVAMYPQPQAAFPQHGYGFVQQPYYHQQVYSPSPNAPAASSAQGAAHWPPNGEGHSPMPAGPSCSGQFWYQSFASRFIDLLPSHGHLLLEMPRSPAPPVMGEGRGQGSRSSKLLVQHARCALKRRHRCLLLHPVDTTHTATTVYLEALGDL
ncbi:tyrosine-protein phosphatase non-receptor type 23-like [Thrips palmi]|uniref:Tyrosine-protein phosphatase non-receptor type 23-like n=1 Tax=Thrips palmi TaxID=161013 RepID=A0A6P8YI66_THRPL|nr:tyrosine-protein phosphatase non-receptor type 23-like [Thrips palmi]